MTEPYTSADMIKSMRMFFIDNQGAWPSHAGGSSKAELIDDAFVVWPDEGRYPTYVPVAVSTHPNFKGLIVVQAGNRGLLVSFVKDATKQEDLQAAFRTMENVEQYRVAVDSLVHRMVLWQSKADRTSEVDPLSLISWMASSGKGKISAAVIGCALAALMETPDKLRDVTAAIKLIDPKADAFMVCDGLLTSLQQATSFRATQAGVSAPVKRRDG